MSDDAIFEYAGRLVRRKARQLVGKAGITKGDADDIAQDLHVDLLERMHGYDPRKADARRFVKKLVRHRISKLLRERLAQKRGNGQAHVSLNETLTAPTGAQVERAETIPDPRDPDGTGAELRAEVAEVLSRLPPELRDFCELLKAMTITEVAAHLKSDRANLYRRIRRLRPIFADAGLGRLPKDGSDTSRHGNG